jgi:hypothetical protein
MTISGTIEQSPGDAYYFTDVLKGDILFRSYGSNSFTFGSGSNVLSSLRVNTNTVSMWANNFAFGTANPQALFHIYNGIAPPSFLLDGGNLGGRGALKMINTNAGNYIQSGVQLSNDSKADLIFTSMMGNTEWMRIKSSSGNVGIGITNPLYSIHVPNTAYFGSTTTPNIYTSNISTTSCNLNIGCDSTTNSVNIACGSNNQTVNIGTSTATTTINIGGVGDTVNIVGTTNFVQTTELQVSDKLITLNKGGTSLSAIGSGFEIEESNAITSYIKTSSDRNSFLFRAPASTQDLVMNLSSGGMNINNGCISVSSSLNVGIGTTAPAYAFDVINTSNIAIIRVGQSDGGFGRLILGNINYGIARGAKISTAIDPNDVAIHTTSTGSIAFCTNGPTEYMRINNAGNVGIRTTNPSYALDISSTDMRLQGGTGTTPTTFYLNSTGASTTTSILQFVNNANYIACTDSNYYNNTGRPVIGFNTYYKSAGHNFTGPTQFVNNVGIGTSNATQKLDINNGSIVVRNGNTYNANTNDQILLSYAGNDTFKHSIKTRHSTLNNIDNSIDFYTWKLEQASQTDVGNQLMMSITSAGVAIGKSNNNPSYMLDVNGIFNASNILINGSPINPLPSFWTQANMGNYSGCNLGIGTSNYAAKLHIKGSGTSELERLESTTSTSAAFVSYTNGVSYNYIGIDGSGWANTNVGSLTLLTACNNPIVFGTNNTQKMILDASGQLGIGTTAPAYKLDVNSTGMRLQGGTGTTPTIFYLNSTGVATTTSVLQFVNNTNYIACTDSNSYDNTGRSVAGFNTYYKSGGHNFTGPTQFVSNVGIGTTTPLANLHVGNDYFVSANSGAWNATTGKGLYMRYSTNSTQDEAYIQSIDRSVTKYYNLGIEASNLAIGSTGSLASPYLYCQYGGNVGIGTNAPTAKLDVIGSGQFGSTTNYKIGISDYEIKMKGVGYKHYSIYNSNNVFSIQDTSTAVTFGVVGSTALSISGLNVGIGTLAPATKLHTYTTGTANSIRIQGDVAQQQSIEFYDTASRWLLYKPISSTDIRWSTGGADKMSFTTAGALTCVGDIAAFGSISDRKFKENIVDLNGNLGTISKLRPVEFTWKNDIENESYRGLHDYGLIAQELEEVIPEAVKDVEMNGDTYKSVKYERLIPFLIGSIKELQAENIQLKETILEIKNYLQI